MHVPSRPQDSRRRILLIDDDDEVRGTTARLLAFNHDVVVSASSRDALRLLQEGPAFDVVITDQSMPDLDGLELTEEILSRRLHPPGQILFLTASIDESTVSIRDISMPVLRKPATRKEILAAIEALATTDSEH